MKIYRYCCLLMLSFAVLSGCTAKRAAENDQELLDELKRDEQLFKDSEGTRQSNEVEDKNPRHYTTVHDAFTAHDTNGDGYIDQHEFVQFQTDPEIVRIRNSIPELAESGPLLFVEIDENEDDRITLQEMTTITQPLLVEP